MHSGRLTTTRRGARHGRADLAARPARPPPRPPAGHRARRRRRRRAAGLDRHVPVVDHVDDDPARDRARPGRLAGRGPARRATPADVLRHGPAPARASRARCPVSFATTTGLQATTGGSTQQTGPGQVLGLPAGYAPGVPGRAAHARRARHRRAARPADRRQPPRRARRHGHDRPARRRRRARCKVDGVVDLPAADSLFQKVGAPVGAQPQAPPDNVVLLPAAHVRPRRARRAGRRTQVHARARRTRCPAARAPPSRRSPGSARNLETQLAGGGLVGDNLGTALDSARQDALYARAAVPVPRRSRARSSPAWSPRRSPSAGADRRRRDAALLRTRGASTRQLVRVALGETALAGGVGVAARARRRAAHRLGRVRDRELRRLARSPRVLWAGGAAARRAASSPPARSPCPPGATPRALTVAGQRAQIGRRDRAPWWARYGLDFVALAGSALVFWQASTQRLQPRARPRGRPAGLGQLVRAAGPGARLDRRRPARLPARRPRPRPRPRAAGARCCARSPASSRRPSPRRWAASAGCSPRPSRSSR